MTYYKQDAFVFTSKEGIMEKQAQVEHAKTFFALQQLQTECHKAIDVAISEKRIDVAEQLDKLFWQLSSMSKGLLSIHSKSTEKEPVYMESKID